MAVLGSCLHRIRASMHIIAQGFGVMKYFPVDSTTSLWRYAKLCITPLIRLTTNPANMTPRRAIAA